MSYKGRSMAIHDLYYTGRGQRLVPGSKGGQIRAIECVSSADFGVEAGGQKNFLMDGMDGEVFG